MYLKEFQISKQDKIRRYYEWTSYFVLLWGTTNNLGSLSNDV